MLCLAWLSLAFTTRRRLSYLPKVDQPPTHYHQLKQDAEADCNPTGLFAVCTDGKACHQKCCNEDYGKNKG